MRIRFDKLFKILICCLFILPILITNGAEVKKGTVILAYHAVNDNITGIEELFVSPNEFYRQIEYLSKSGYKPLHFNEIKDYTKYKKTVIVTFDDGYADNYHIAYPILKKFNFKATIFMVAGYINKPGYLSEAQIREMTDIISFQSHTLKHPELDKLHERELEKECIISKSMLEEITGQPVHVLAYPYGCYSQQVIDIVSKHYEYAVNTKRGIYNEAVGDYEINRICICRSHKFSAFIRLLYAE